MADSARHNSTRADTAADLAIELAPDFDELARARIWLLPQLDTGRDDRRFMTALTEILTNAIEEHGRLGIDAPIRVELTDSHVCVIDQGSGFAPDLSGVGANEGTRGVAIVGALAPGTTWTIRDSGGTRVQLPLSAP